MERVVAGVRHDGFAIVSEVFDADFVDQARGALYSAQKKVVAEVGEEKLIASRELGVVRLPMKFEPIFFKFLESPKILSIVDKILGNTSILHLQNGFILPSADSGHQKDVVFQQSFHPDFPRFLNGYLASLNCLVAIDDFTENNGATAVVPGTHQQDSMPNEHYLKWKAIKAVCPAGSVIVFDSTLLHAATFNVSGRDRCAVNLQFTRSFIKQQFDYVRALGDREILKLNSRTQQLLGWYTRVVTSLDEYYRPPQDRLYRSGQG